MKHILAMRILAVGIVLCAMGCERSQSKAPAAPVRDNESDKKEMMEARDPLGAMGGFFIPVADGTVYFFGENKIFWLLEGRATEIPNDADAREDLPEWRVRNSYIDANGGVYIGSTSHLWYLKDGRINKVSIVDRTLFTSQPAKVTLRSILWAARYREALIEEHDYESAVERAYSDGWDAAKKEMGQIEE